MAIPRSNTLNTMKMGDTRLMAARADSPSIMPTHRASARLASPRHTEAATAGKKNR